MLRCQRILAMPGKRCVRRTVEFLDRAEMDGLLAAHGSTKYATCNSCNGKHIRSKCADHNAVCVGSRAFSPASILSWVALLLTLSSQAPTCERLCPLRGSPSPSQKSLMQLKRNYALRPSSSDFE